VTARRIVTADGVHLALHRLCESTGRPAALCVHGAFCSHTAWLRVRGGAGGGFADLLDARGYDVWLADLRHHGASEREPKPRTWRFQDCILRDAPALVAHVAAETNGAPLAWIGHSFGSVIGLCWLARQETPPPEVKAVVALGTPGPGGISLKRRTLALGAILLARLLGRLPARALRLGPEDEAAHIIGDWMGWNVRGRWLGRDGFDYFAALPHLRTPFMAVAGEGDHLMAPPFACREVLDKVGAAQKKFLVGGPHLDHAGLLIDPKARERCWPAVADWLDATLPRA